MAEEMQMPDMAGANMNSENPMRNLPPEAQKNLLQPDEEIAAMLVARLSAMSEQELAMLDTVIHPRSGTGSYEAPPRATGAYCGCRGRW